MVLKYRLQKYNNYFKEHISSFRKNAFNILI